MSARIVQAILMLGALGHAAEGGTPDPTLGRHLMPLLKARCVKCHGPAKREGKLSLASPKGLARGGKSRKLVTPGRPDESLIWDRVADDEMPPDAPLSADEKALLRRWIEGGAAGLPATAGDAPEAADHWAFARLGRSPPPRVRDASLARGGIDRFLLKALEAEGLTFAPEADRATLVRRVSFDLTGLPPSPGEVASFLADGSPDAYERMVERRLASPRYGERWGKYWLDAAGYADSNGYFAADSDRPLAFRYRDYVIRSWNEDKPLDRFLREQLAGDELSGFRRGGTATAETAGLLAATHFLRNSQDGTGESDGNPDELRADRYAVLEGTIEVLGSSLFGLTFQCARCHDHKYEPVSQKDYYQLQAILYPAFPVENWVKPNDRVVEAPLPAELAAWEERGRSIDAELAKLTAEHRSWVERNRRTGTVLFRDDFDDAAGGLSPRWGPRAPGDDATAGAAGVNVDSETAPGAMVKNGVLRIIESGAPGNRWLSTTRAFDWTPDAPGAWVQATFDLVDRRVDPGATPAERVGYYLALVDFRDDGPTDGGNVLLDGNPAGGAAVLVDYPGADARTVGKVGTTGYAPGRRYGVRVTNAGAGKFRLEHVVDWTTEGDAVTLTAADLPDGGFGFEYCCGRSFEVDRVLIESSGPPPKDADAARESKALDDKRAERQKAFEKALAALEARRGPRPGRIAWVSDLSAKPPEVHLLNRGAYNDRGPVVAPGVPSVLCDPDNPFEVVPPAGGVPSTGGRLALANWITRPGSRAAALFARVTANRIWQHHFGTGLVATPENLGYSGATPSHPELLEDLARALVQSGWSAKSLHRAILNSAAYRQSSAASAAATAADPDNRLLGRFPLRRLDAEAVRDAMLAVSGELDDRAGGPAVPVSRKGADAVQVDESVDGARRRSVYVQQRRSNVVGLLEVFDSPSIVTNCTRRNATTTPLQSLSLLNSDFVRARALALGKRLEREAGAGSDDRVALAFLLASGRPPREDELAAARKFLAAQPGRYPGRADAVARSWTDFCQAVLAGNAFLYVE